MAISAAETLMAAGASLELDDVELPWRCKLCLVALNRSMEVWD